MIAAAAGFIGAVTGIAAGESSIPAAEALVAVLATAAGAVLGFMGFTGPGRTVDSVTRAARAISRGEYSGPLETPGHAADDLAFSFNSMTERLQQIMDESTAGRARVEAVLAATNNAIIALSADSTVKYLNPSAQRLLRVHADDAVGRPFIESAHDYELQEMVRETAESRAAAAPHVITFGQDRVQLRATAMPIHGGGDWDVLLVLNDLSEIQRLDQVRRDFVSNVSHELRTPLAAARALVETLQDEPDAPPSEREPFLTRLLQQVERMTTMVDELLDLSRIETGAIHLQPEHLRIADMVSEAESIQRTRLEQHKMRIETEIEGEVTAEADRTAVIRILSNLLDNAIKYGGDGSSVHIAAREDTDLVSITVRDEGPGIAAADLPRVFERFYKAEHSRTSSGVGLGLAIVKHLVRAHGGAIDVASPPGGGAVFTIKLPKSFIGVRHENNTPARGRVR